MKPKTKNMMIETPTVGIGYQAFITYYLKAYIESFFPCFLLFSIVLVGPFGIYFLGFYS